MDLTDMKGEEAQWKPLALLTAFPQFDHETSICKLDCISLTTDTAECARKNEKKENANM